MRPRLLPRLIQASSAAPRSTWWRRNPWRRIRRSLAATTSSSRRTRRSTRSRRWRNYRPNAQATWRACYRARRRSIRFPLSTGLELPMQHRRPLLSLVALVYAGAALLLGASAAAPAAEPDAFYKGKTISIYIGFAAGGSYDYFGRLASRHLGKHLPGNPTVIAEAMPGAGSFTAANYLYARAARDGTVLGIVSQTVAIEEALGTPSVQYKAAKFNWVGRAASVNEVSFTFHTSNTKTIQDAMARETTMASTGAGSPSETYLKLLNSVAATKFKLVGPYPASNDSMLAMERGEVDGAFTSYNTLKVSHQDWLRDKTINILVQYGERSAELPDVPFAVDLAKTDEDKQLMALRQLRADRAC